MLNVIQLKYETNYIYIIHNKKLAVVIDPTNAEIVQKAILQHSLDLVGIINTHHHQDHIAGNDILMNFFGCPVYAHYKNKGRIPKIHVPLFTDLYYPIAGLTEPYFFEINGHVDHHIGVYIKELGALFVGDVVFSLGCGRVFEGTHQDLLRSIQTIAKYPDDTYIYCAHEYTYDNARFLKSLYPNNPSIQTLASIIKEKYNRSIPTVPSRLSFEKDFNPFFQCSKPGFATSLGLDESSSPLEILTHLRNLKDQFV